MPRSTDDEERRPASRVTTTELLRGLGAAAGTTAIVYVIGGMVMWLRFRKAGLPADQAVAVMERQQLLVIGLRLMVLPAVLTGALAWAVMSLRGSVLVLGDRTRVIVKTALAVVLAALGLMLPFSFASVTWVIAALVVVGYLRYERRPLSARWRKRGGSLPFVRRRAGHDASPFVATLLVVVVAALVSLGRQLDQPVHLLTATVDIEGRAAPLEGVYVSGDSDEVFVGVEDQLRAIPRSTVRSVALGPPGERAPSPSLASRLLGGGRYSITPFEWWCDGERYGWGEVGDLCQTQLEILTPRFDLAGDAVPVRVRCPAAAGGPCRGHLRLTSREPYLFGPHGLPQPVVLRAAVAPAGAAGLTAAGIAPGHTDAMCVPVNSAVRGLLRNRLPGAAATAVAPGPAKRPIPFDLTVSADAEGRNVVRRQAFSVAVTRPDQPIEFWGDCASIRVTCRGKAGTRRRADIACQIRARRRFTGTARLEITDRAATTVYARATGRIAGPSRDLTPAPTRTIPPGGDYRASVTIDSGPSSSHFVQSGVRLR